MALTFGSNTANRVNCGSGSAIDDVPVGGQMTVCAWYKPVLGALQVIASKANSTGPNNGWRLLQTSGDRVQFVVEAASGAETNYQSSNSSLTAVWSFVSATFNFANGALDKAHICKGSLTVPVAELAYASRVDGASVGTDAGHTLELGNLTTAGSFSVRGGLAWVGVWKRELSLAQLRAVQFDPIGEEPWGRVGMWILGDKPGTQLDLSPYGNHGTITGATYASAAELDTLLYPDEPSMAWAKMAAGAPATFKTYWARNSNVLLRGVA
jgi:hypothetical protein